MLYRFIGTADPRAKAILYILYYYILGANSRANGSGTWLWINFGNIAAAALQVLYYYYYIGTVVNTTPPPRCMLILVQPGFTHSDYSESTMLISNKYSVSVVPVVLFKREPRTKSPKPILPLYRHYCHFVIVLYLLQQNPISTHYDIIIYLDIVQ